MSRSRKDRTNRTKELQEMVSEIDEEGVGLSDWEVEFIGGMVDEDRSVFSEAQETVIRRIHEEKLK